MQAKILYIDLLQRFVKKTKNSIVLLFIISSLIIFNSCTGQKHDILIKDSGGGSWGKGFGNSLLQGDSSMGKLISPDFVVKRKYIVFRVGGSDVPFGWTSDPAYVAVQLVSKGSIIRNGPTYQMRAISGVSEELKTDYFDVSDYIRQSVHLEIVDSSRTGHIFADQFYQSDQKPFPDAKFSTKKLVIGKRWLNVPINKNAPFRQMKIFVDGQMVIANQVPFDLKSPDIYVPVDMTPWIGKTANLEIEEIDSPGQTSAMIAEQLITSELMTDSIKIYDNPLRPVFHYMPRFGSCTDANGLLYYDGEYHLGYQCVPFKYQPPYVSSVTWGHAISTDLVNWKELPMYFWPDKDGPQWSGSGVADMNNTSGLKSGKEDPLVVFYTSAGSGTPWSPNGKTTTISMAYSNDRGRTWTKYAGNPILNNINRDNRDPYVFWYEPGKHWVMALYIHNAVNYLFTSNDLKHWEKQSEIHGFHECPSFFELPVDGNMNNKKWVFFGGTSDYVIGTFDGKEFKAETEKRKFAQNSGFYAPQVFNNVPDGRKIWSARCNLIEQSLPDGMQTFPIELTLRTTDGNRMELFKYPVEEIKKLYKNSYSIPVDQKLIAGKSIRPSINGRAFDINAEITPNGAGKFKINIFGQEIIFNVKEMEMNFFDLQRKRWIRSPLVMISGKIQLRILIDKIYMEIFIADGRYYVPVVCTFDLKNDTFELSSEGGNIVLNKFDIHELKTIWNKNEN